MAVIYLFSPQLVCLGAFDAASLIHSEASYQVTCEFKTDQNITSGYCIGFKCIDGRFRLFEIDEVDYRDDPGDLFITGTDLAVRELTDIVVTDIRCNTMTASAALEHLLEASESGWVVGDVITTDSASSRHYYKSLWECIVHLMDVYSVRMVPYFTISGACEITARDIDIISTTPVYRGRLLESGDEASSVVVTVSGNPKTALYGRGKGVESENDSGDSYYGPRLTFADVVWSTANGDPVDKPLHQEWVGDPTALAAFGRNGDHRYGVVVFEDITDAETLLQKTWEYLQTVSFPTVSATAAVYDLEMAQGYSWAAVRVNDLILIRPRLFPADVSAAITKIDRDYVNPANTRIEISTTGVATSASSLYTETTKKLEAVEQIDANVLTRDSIINTMVTKIMSSGTTMYTDEDSGAFVFVSDDGTSAMMLTGGGWMIADEKVGDVWQWRTAATGDGIVADEITTGMLQASVVKIFGSDHFYWDANNIYIKEGVGTPMNLYGVTLTKTDGTFYTYYVNSTDIASSLMRLNCWTSTVAAGTTITIHWDSSDADLYFNYYDGPSLLQETLAAGGGETTITLTEDSSSAWVINAAGATVTGFSVFELLEDLTDVGTTWDLGDITIPATESAYSAVLKSACTLGTYTLTVESISSDTDVTISTVNLSTSAEVDVVEITTGNISETIVRKYAFDLMYGRSAPSLRQIRIGCYDGENYGIGYTTDGGETWTTAIDFSGLNFSGDVVSLTTQGGYINIAGTQLTAGSGSTVNILSGGNLYCRAGSVANFVTDDFVIQNSNGDNLMTVSSVEGTEGQVFLGDEGFPVNFAGGFILPVANGGTGYSSGQVHRTTGTPSSGLGADGDLAIRYASSSGAYSAFTPSVTAASSKSGSVATHGGMQRYWNNSYAVDNAIPQNHWAAGNDNGYAYGIYAEFTSPTDPVSGAITLEMTGYKYYQNNNILTCYIIDSSNNILASGTISFAYRSSGVAQCTFSSVSLAASTTYYLLVCDVSAQTGNTSKSYISMGSITFPAYSGSTSCGLYIKSAGSWVTVFTT